DAMYGVLFELVTEQRVGKNLRMQQVIDKEQNPVSQALRSMLPEYLPWFASWRTERNDIKTGTNFGIIGPDDNIGVSFNTVDEHGGLTIDLEGRVIRQHDLAAGIRMSAALARTASAIARSRLN